MSTTSTTRKRAATKRAPARKAVVKKAASAKRAANVSATKTPVSKPAAEPAESKARKGSKGLFMVLDSPLKPKHVTLAQIRAALQKVS